MNVSARPFGSLGGLETTDVHTGACPSTRNVLDALTTLGSSIDTTTALAAPVKALARDDAQRCGTVPFCSVSAIALVTFT